MPTSAYGREILEDSSLLEAKADLDAATRRSDMDAAARKLMHAKALKQLDAEPAEPTRRTNRARGRRTFDGVPGHTAGTECVRAAINALTGSAFLAGSAAVAGRYPSVYSKRLLTTDARAHSLDDGNVGVISFAAPCARGPRPLSTPKTAGMSGVLEAGVEAAPMTVTIVGLICVVLGAVGLLVCLLLAIRWGILRPPSPEDYVREPKRRTNRGSRSAAASS